MTDKQPKLRMLVGADLNEHRYEVGALVDHKDLTDKQRAYLLREGYAEEQDVEVSALDPKAEEKVEAAEEDQ